MKKFITLVIAVCLAVALAGCGSPASETESESPGVEATPGELSFTATPDIESELVDKVWISPGKVTIDNLYPGAQAEYSITIHNGNDVETPFAVTVRTPDHVGSGYEPLPEEYHSWITISDPSPVMAPKESKDVLVTVAMPGDASYPNKDVEVWISIIDQGQEGMIRTELCSRWLISTR